MDGFPFWRKLKLFCGNHDIDILDMSGRYTTDRARSCSQRDPITLEHHFRIEIFLVTVDSQLQELNNKFKEDVIELLVLSTSLDPRDGFKSFNIEDICELANRFYPMDITERKKIAFEVLVREL